ncbi:unnamed protein product, partial [Brassica oleracea var. botrytis]
PKKKSGKRIELSSCNDPTGGRRKRIRAILTFDHVMMMILSSSGTKSQFARLLTEINIIKNKVSSSSSLEDAEKWKHEELAEEEKKPEMTEKTVALPSSRRWTRKSTPVKSW